MSDMTPFLIPHDLDPIAGSDVRSQLLSAMANVVGGEFALEIDSEEPTQVARQILFSASVELKARSILINLGPKAKSIFARVAPIRE